MYKNFLSLLFKENEEVCASSNKYACPSTTQDLVNPENTELIAINPIVGQRCDANVTAYRTFLVEMDDGSLKEQHQYIQDLGMPYSTCIFSGNKSLHFGIVLMEDLVSEEVYRFLAQWILNIVSRADQNTKNPSRSIRFPGHLRNGSEQKLIELKERISQEILFRWLNQYPDKKPQPRIKKEVVRAVNADMANLPAWAIKVLMEGVPEGKSRNQTWFGIGWEMYVAGFDEDDVVPALEQFYDEENDFRYKEWSFTVLNGFQKAALEKE